MSNKHFTTARAIAEREWAEVHERKLQARLAEQRRRKQERQRIEAGRRLRDQRFRASIEALIDNHNTRRGVA